MDKRDRARSILGQLTGINQNAGTFTAGMLSNDISKERQIAFATRLVDLAIAIEGRAEEAAGLVAEGSVIDDSIIDGRALPAAGTVRSDSPLRQEIPRFADALALAATPAAIGCAQRFVSHMLYHWNAPFVENDALQAVTELVTHAVQATGVTDGHLRWSALGHLNLIRVRLLGMETSIVVEVWDSEPALPESTSQQWNYFHPCAGGKVVWCELEFPQRSRALGQTQEPLPALPQRKRRPSPRPTRPRAAEKDPKLLRRVLDGLLKLDDVPGGDDRRY